MDVDRATGASQRRRGRRLRAALRHEQQSFAIALAEAAQGTTRAQRATATRAPASLAKSLGAPGTGAARSGADRGFRASGADPRGGRPQDHRKVATCCCRASYRSAQDHSRGQHPAAHCAPRATTGGAAVGSANSCVSCRAHRWHSSSGWCWRYDYSWYGYGTGFNSASWSSFLGFSSRPCPRAGFNSAWWSRLRSFSLVRGQSSTALRQADFAVSLGFPLDRVQQRLVELIIVVKVPSGSRAHQPQERHLGRW